MVNSVVLKVHEAHKHDVGHCRARIDERTRKVLGADKGDIIEIIGRSGRSTSARVFVLYPEEENKGIIRIDSLIRKNANTSLGEKVEVRKAVPKPATSVTIAPVIPEKKMVSYPRGIETYIKARLKDRPLCRHDVIRIEGLTIGGGTGLSFFFVENCKPKGITIVIDNTMIIVKEEGTTGKDIEKRVSYEDIGGLSDKVERVREIIELPLRHPELFNRLGIDPPKGVLLYGPPGTGKTLIAKAVANEANVNFFPIGGPEIMDKFYGGSEEKLRERFERAKSNSPAILFIDEVDSIAPRRDDVTGDVEKRVVSQLLNLMDGLTERGNLIVIGATNRIDAIDPALRRPGRFDREIEIGVPDKKGRKEILQIHTRGMPIDINIKDELLDEIADLTHGYVGADLAALTREAGMVALRRYIPDIDLDTPIPIEILEKMQVTRDDFRIALKNVQPSLLREVITETPKIRFSDIGGLDEIKQILKESVELPLKNPALFKRFGIKQPRGILLYGPPGTGKTMIAKAIATESHVNFISVKGPEIFSKWVGESEKAIRKIFRKALQSAPCIVFFDEIDAITRRRGLNTDSGVSERVIDQLLTSMDNIDSSKNVVVIGATNRPDLIDAAILRIGRFDKRILVQPPDPAERLEIFKIHTKNMPLNEDVNLVDLASKTEGYVGADIEAICREAALNSLRSKEAEVRSEDFNYALKIIKPSVSKEIVEHYESIMKELESGISKRKKDDIGLIYHR
jgi:transitional endoplasmic reticulum ATPase